MANIGSDDWWQHQKGPQWQQQQDHCLVTFSWRDPAGSEQQSAIRRVWIIITGITDHHQNSHPQSLQRVAGTDVWQWQTTLPASWRGSYCFIPSTAENDFPAELLTSDQPDKTKLRECWRRLLPLAIADPLNPQSWRGGRGHGVSALELPAALPQPGWQLSTAAPLSTSSPDTAVRCIDWHSQRLGNKRRVWLFTTDNGNTEHNASRPLALLLDGQFWAKSLPVWPALTQLTRQRQLPPAIYLLIDVIDTAHRRTELPCNTDFWLAIQQELLPKIQSLVAFSDNPQHTIVAGQSFGGLSAMFAALHWPQRFGCVLSQSGSFWWSNKSNAQDGLLIEQLKRGEAEATGLRIWLEAGQREPTIFQANQTLLFQLLAKPDNHIQLFWRPQQGGHDAFCWRGGLTAGLIQLWQPLM